MDKLRLKFSKTGKAVYISHLDLMRTMQRSFLRAGYSLKYSEGFNPHAQISILLPLSVGAESVCELMDFSLTGEEDLAAMSERLCAAMPAGIEALDVYPGGRKLRELKWLGISGVFEYDERDPELMAEELEKFFSADSIVIVKRTKRGEGESDIAPAIKEISFARCDEGVKVSAIVSAQNPTLNPDNLVAALRQKAPGLAPDFARFKRCEVYDEKMEIFR